MRIVPEVSGTSIALVGSFNPAIFTPAWFELHGLLPQGTAEIAKLEVAHAQATAFSSDWLHLNVVDSQWRPCKHLTCGSAIWLYERSEST